MEATLPNEHRLWLILIKSEFYFYLCSGRWKSILLCLAFLWVQDLYFYAEAFFIDNEFLSHDLCILHVFIHVILTVFIRVIFTVVKGSIFHAMYFRFLQSGKRQRILLQKKKWRVSLLCICIQYALVWLFSVQNLKLLGYNTGGSIRDHFLICKGRQTRRQGWQQGKQSSDLTDKGTAAKHPDKKGAEQYPGSAIWLGIARKIHSDDASLQSIQGAAGQCSGTDQQDT